MPSWIWNQDDLRRFTRHPKPMVRLWACERLKTLYGKTGLEVLERLLKDRDKEVLLEALDYLESYPEQRFNDLVLKAYETNTEAVAGRCALILGQFKDERLIPAYERKIKAKTTDHEGRIWMTIALGELGTDQARKILRDLLLDITEDTDPYLIDVLIKSVLKAKEDILVLLETYARVYRKMGMEILYPITVICGSGYILEDVKTEGKKRWLGGNLPPVVQESLDFVKRKNFSSLAKELQQAFSRKDYRQVIETAWQWAEKIIEEKGDRVREELSLRSDLPPSVNYQMLRAFKDFLRSGPEDSFRGIAIATLVILARFIELKSLWGLKIDEVDPPHLFPILFEDRDTVPMDEALIEKILAVCEPQIIFDYGLEQLNGHPDSYGTDRVLKLIGKLKNPRAIPYLVPFLNRSGNDDLREECIEAMVQIGSPVVDYLEKNFNQLNDDQLAEFLFALRDIPEEKTADFLLAHWDKLWSLEKESFLDALEGIAYRRFIEPLRKELKEGEGMDEEVFSLLCYLNEVNDALLPQIEKNINERKRETEKTLEAWRKNSSRALQPNTARVELKCLRCGKPYLYEVGNIYFTPEKKTPPMIMDKIVCKNCRAINQYEITAKGHLAITSHMILTAALMEEERLKPGEGPIQLADTGLMNGQRMSVEKVLEYYKTEIKKSPQDPALRVGHGNVLLKKGAEDEAVRQYKEALRLDPLAVEAYASLGEFEADKGNLSGAYEYFRQAAERIHTGNYYRTKEIDQLKEAVIFNLEYFEKVLGKTGERSPAPVSQGIIKKEKVGRNAPCPCGSGKKYKKCCLIKEEGGRPEKTSATPQELELRDKLISFAANEKFKKDFARAYALYWRKPFREPLVLDEKEEVNFSLFLDWFIHDFKLGNGLTIIEEFYQRKKEEHSLEEHALLQFEMASHFSIYEVLEVTPEEGIKLKDLFTGEALDILEVSGTRTVAKWDIIFARVINMGPINKFSGIITLIPRREKEDILSAIKREWEKFKEETRKTEWADFAKLNAERIQHIIEDQPRKDPVFVTEERHLIVSAKAIFTVKNFDTLRYRLGREFDFVLDEEEEGKKGEWTWLKRGPSKDWEAGEEKEYAVILKSEMIAGKGELRWVSLGTVTWTPGRLELWCLSKERLNRGKKRLREILGDDIRHLADTYEDIKKMTKRKPKEDSSFQEEEMQEKFQPIYFKMMEEWATQWLDEKIPALDGKTPREAVLTPDGREKVEDLLKDWENVEERKKRDGDPYIDIQVIRKMLRL